ncbi:MAG: NAD(P)H-hydrate dehydratase [Clostridia bacterium]|nr:NAD(P)H-hydrate dehydratase [Clostridia bacterium]
MERVLTVEQMRVADSYTIEKLGVMQSDLVERAGRAVAGEILKRFCGGRVLVCVGKGNNGADGRVVANILSKKHGYSVVVYNVATGMLKIFDKKFDIIVDCIFGTGLNKNVDGKYKNTIEKINASGAYVVSCDIASGLNGDNGWVMGEAVRANLTVAIQEYKLGHFLNDGIDYSGQVVCKDIGISVWDEDCAKRLNDDDVKRYFPLKPRNSHKGTFGSACVIGGSKQYTGSILLSANALCAMKMGAGYSYLVVPKSLFNSYVGLVPECTLSCFEDDGEGYVLDIKNIERILKCDAISFGMGVGVSRSVYDIIVFLLDNYNGTLVLDADALNCLSKYGVSVLKNKKCKVIVTPHVGEFSRLTGVEKGEILYSPIDYAKDFAKKFGIVVLLKNAVSIITDDKEVYLNTTGCSGMAKAGSGDVLSGILAGVLAREESVLEATAVASYVFGKAGERVCKEQNEYTMTASDIINALPLIINEIRS